jgi:hypothetical protein
MTIQDGQPNHIEGLGLSRRYLQTVLKPTPKPAGNDAQMLTEEISIESALK